MQKTLIGLLLIFTSLYGEEKLPKLFVGCAEVDHVDIKTDKNSERLSGMDHDLNFIIYEWGLRGRRNGRLFARDISTCVHPDTQSLGNYSVRFLIERNTHVYIRFLTREKTNNKDKDGNIIYRHGFVLWKYGTGVTSLVYFYGIHNTMSNEEFEALIPVGTRFRYIERDSENRLVVHTHKIKLPDGLVVDVETIQQP